MEKKNQSIWEKLDNVPSVVFLLLPIIVVSIPIIHPVGIPITVTDYTKNSFKVLNNLPNGSVVVIANGAITTTDANIGPTLVAINKYLWTRHMKTIFFSYAQEGVTVPMLKSIVTADPNKFGQKYGQDYVVFGLVGGFEGGVASFAADMAKTYPVDFYGNPTTSLPLMQKVNSAKDVNLVVSTIAYCTETDLVARQWVQAYKVPVIMLLSINCVFSASPYYPQQIPGLLVDVQGGAETERVTGFPGQATSYLDAQSFGGFLVLFIIIASNIVMLGLKRTRKEKMKK